MVGPAGYGPSAQAPRLERSDAPAWTTLEACAVPETVCGKEEVEEDDACASPWALEAGLGLYSQYVWRGFLVGDDPVLQGSVTLDYKDFSFNVWGNVDLTDVHETEWDLNEVDLTLDYSRGFRLGCVPLEGSAGAIAYFFPVTDTPTLLEFYAGLSADVFLQPSLFVYREVLDQEYTYVSLDLGHTFDLGCLSLDLGAGVGWGDHAWHRVLHDVGGEAFHEFHCRAALQIPRGDWTFSPTFWWSSLFRDEVRGVAEQSDLFVAALVVSYTF